MRSYNLHVLGDNGNELVYSHYMLTRNELDIVKARLFIEFGKEPISFFVESDKQAELGFNEIMADLDRCFGSVADKKVATAKHYLAILEELKQFEFKSLWDIDQHIRDWIGSTDLFFNSYHELSSIQFWLAKLQWQRKPGSLKLYREDEKHALENHFDDTWPSWVIPFVRPE